MGLLEFLILFLVAFGFVYLLFRSRSRSRIPPPQRYIRRGPRLAQAPGALSPGGNTAEARSISSNVGGSPVELSSSGQWQPMSCSQLEAETRWRLEHVLRQLPELDDTSIVRIDYDMEPREIASLLASNPFYAAKILKTVNSAAFGLRHRIDSLQRAITFLGYNEVKNIVLQHAINSSMEKAKAKIGHFDLLQFWKHSHAVSTCSDFLLRDVLHQTLKVGQITTAALLHDIGWVVFSYYDSDAAARFFQCLHNEPDIENPLQLEEETFGFNHLVAGRMLAEQWRISKEICQLISLHHCGTFGFGKGIDRERAFGACIIAKAEQLTHEMNLPNPLPEPTELSVDMTRVLGDKAAGITGGSVKLRESIEKTLRLIEEFQRNGSGGS